MIEHKCFLRTASALEYDLRSESTSYITVDELQWKTRNKDFPKILISLIYENKNKGLNMI